MNTGTVPHTSVAVTGRTICSCVYNALRLVRALLSYLTAPRKPHWSKGMARSIDVFIGDEGRTRNATVHARGAEHYHENNH